MYNLLIKGSGWHVSHDTLPLERLLTYTENEISHLFYDGGKPALKKLMELPCLFMQEGDINQLAQVGYITHAAFSGNKVSLEYAFDNNIPALRNSIIAEHRNIFGITNGFEIFNTHWAVKDVDLYRALIRHGYPQRQHPSVFQIPRHEEIEADLISAMMPFDASFSKVHKSLRTVAEGLEMRLLRADDIWEKPEVIQDVVSLIDRSRIVVCDCTGRNPNVFYEAGIAHTLGREVILITQSEKDIPFDLRHLRFVLYLNNNEGLKNLRKELEARIRYLLEK